MIAITNGAIICAICNFFDFLHHSITNNCYLCIQNDTICTYMTKKIKTLTIDDINSNVMQSRLQRFTLGQDYAVAQGLQFSDNPYIQPGHMLLLKEARIGFITSGEAIIEINLTEYRLHKGMIVLLPNDTVVCLKANDDYRISGTILMPTIHVTEAIILQPEDDKENDTLKIYNTLCSFCNNHSDRHHIVELLQRAIVENVNTINKKKSSYTSSLSPASRGEEIFKHFKILVSNNARTERSVAFYANKLCVSPHYLMSVIQRVSGQSVMKWVEHAALLHAKILLATTDEPLYSIAATMNFPTSTAFCRWFKRLDGKTPLEARELRKNTTNKNL